MSCERLRDLFQCWHLFVQCVFQCCALMRPSDIGYISGGPPIRRYSDISFITNPSDSGSGDTRDESYDSGESRSASMYSGSHSFYDIPQNRNHFDYSPPSPYQPPHQWHPYCMGPIITIPCFAPPPLPPAAPLSRDVLEERLTTIGGGVPPPSEPPLPPLFQFIPAFVSPTILHTRALPALILTACTVLSHTPSPLPPSPHRVSNESSISSPSPEPNLPCPQCVALPTPVDTGCTTQYPTSLIGPPPPTPPHPKHRHTLPLRLLEDWKRSTASWPEKCQRHASLQCGGTVPAPL